MNAKTPIQRTLEIYRIMLFILSIQKDSNDHDEKGILAHPKRSRCRQ